jgi:nitrogen fixation NifU-like protein
MSELHEMGELGGMYMDNILEHFHEPHNFGDLPADADIVHQEISLSCGDDLSVGAVLDDGGRVKTVRFNGRGCAISVAAASMISERIKGMTVAELAALGKKDVFDLLGFEPGLSRQNCALLGLKTLQVGVKDYLAKQDGK